MLHLCRLAYDVNRGLEGSAPEEGGWLMLRISLQLLPQLLAGGE